MSQPKTYSPKPIDALTPDELRMEEWRSVIGYSGYYEASSLGRIRRIKAYVSTSVGKILKPHRGSRGYLTVSLWKHCESKTICVHTIVARTFLGKKNGNRKQVNHMDGDKHNNKLSNLELVSPKENVAHAMSLGLSRQYGVMNNNSKLSEDQVLSIRRIGAYMKQVDIAREYGVNRGTILRILNGESWSYLLPSMREVGHEV